MMQISKKNCLLVVGNVDVALDKALVGRTNDGEYYSWESFLLLGGKDSSYFLRGE